MKVSVKVISIGSVVTGKLPAANGKPERAILKNKVNVSLVGPNGTLPPVETDVIVGWDTSDLGAASALPFKVGETVEAEASKGKTERSASLWYISIAGARRSYTSEQLASVGLTPA